MPCSSLPARDGLRQTHRRVAHLLNDDSLPRGTVLTLSGPRFFRYRKERGGGRGGVGFLYPPPPPTLDSFGG